MATDAALRVAPDLLQALEDRLRRLPVDQGIGIQRDFSASGPVATSYANLMGRWDESRTEMTTALDQIAGIVKSIREAFVQVDEQLAASLGGPP